MIFINKINNYFNKVYQNFSKFSKYVIPLFSKEEYNGWKKGQLYKWKCVKCGDEFESKIMTTDICKSEYTRIPRCLKCYPIQSSKSILEKEVQEFIKNYYNGQILYNSRKIIYPLQIDIFLKEKNIGIQFDGLFWHNEKSGKDDNYHLNKTEECQKKSVKLIHVFEDEWLYKKNIVKDIIKSKLGIYDKKIYARKCKINEISHKESNQFLNENHLQGGDNSSIRLGLFYENELISVMTFGKSRFNKKYDFELIRYASKLGYQVIGGASKLLKYFEEKYNPKSLISYADRRYSDGKLYQKIGFEFLRNTKPNYFWTKNKIKLSRYQCQKYKLKELIGDNFDEKLSETENMKINGYTRIFDCGNMVFIKNFKE